MSGFLAGQVDGLGRCRLFCGHFSSFGVQRSGGGRDPTLACPVRGLGPVRDSRSARGRGPGWAGSGGTRGAVKAKSGGTVVPLFGLFVRC